MYSNALAQKQHAPRWVASDMEFTPAFYRPYGAAVETALLMLCAARDQLDRPEGSIHVRAITFRLKSPSSIRGKLKKYGLPATRATAHAALHDIAGMRVVLEDTDDVYRFADLLIASPMAEFISLRDYIAAPKASGYQSLHLLMHIPVHLRGQSAMIPVEIQLRTAAMDIWASIEHDICYKPLHPPLPCEAAYGAR